VFFLKLCNDGKVYNTSALELMMFACLARCQPPGDARKDPAGVAARPGAARPEPAGRPERHAAPGPLFQAGPRSPGESDVTAQAGRLVCGTGARVFWVQN